MFSASNSSLPFTHQISLVKKNFGQRRTVIRKRFSKVLRAWFGEGGNEWTQLCRNEWQPLDHLSTWDGGVVASQRWVRCQPRDSSHVVEHQLLISNNIIVIQDKPQYYVYRRRKHSRQTSRTDQVRELPLCYQRRSQTVVCQNTAEPPVGENWASRQQKQQVEARILVASLSQGHSALLIHKKRRR